MLPSHHAYTDDDEDHRDKDDKDEGNESLILKKATLQLEAKDRPQCHHESQYHERNRPCNNRCPVYSSNKTEFVA